MLKPLKRFLGGLLLIFSAAGALICLAALVAVLLQRPRLVKGAEDAHQLVLSSLKTVTAGLEISRDTLAETKSVVLSTRASLRQLEGTIDELEPVLDTTQKIIEDDLRSVIEAAQMSLEPAQESAQNADRILFALDSISFLTGVNYDPEQTLAEGIAGISAELDPLPGSLDDLAAEISATDQKLPLLAVEIKKIETSLGNIDSVLEDAEDAIDEIQQDSKSLETKLIEIKNLIQPVINRLTLGAAVILLWLVVLQLGLIFQGAELAFGASKR